MDKLEKFVEYCNNNFDEIINDDFLSYVDGVVAENFKEWFNKWYGEFIVNENRKNYRDITNEYLD